MIRARAWALTVVLLISLLGRTGRAEEDLDLSPLLVVGVSWTATGGLAAWGTYTGINNVLSIRRGMRPEAGQLWAGYLLGAGQLANGVLNLTYCYRLFEGGGGEKLQAAAIGIGAFSLAMAAFDLITTVWAHAQPRTRPAPHASGSRVFRGPALVLDRGQVGQRWPWASASKVSPTAITVASPLTGPFRPRYSSNYCRIAARRTDGSGATCAFHATGAPSRPITGELMTRPGGNMSRITGVVVLMLTLALIIGGCTSETAGFCEQVGDCPPGERCDPEQNRCVAIGTDAGMDSGATNDGSQPDSQPDSLADSTPGADQTRPNGSTCTDGSQCGSGQCVDGVCCDGSCIGTCRSCKVAGAVGTCTLIPADQDPDTECAGADATCSGSCDGTGQCAYPDSATSCDPDSCTGGQLTTHACDGSGGCAAATASCGGFGCASSAACGTTCTTKSDCVSGFECVNKACSSPQVNGASCGTNNAACQSGHCVDGVCCNSGCTGDCHSCTLPGKVGTCSVVADNTSCGATSCTGSTKVDKLCKAGSCTSVSASCALFLCDATKTSCLAACAGDAQCVSTAYCDGSKLCKPKQANGATCGGGNQCQSTFCVGSTCCNSACGPAAACVDGSASSTATFKSCSTGSCQTTTKACGTFRCNATKTGCLASCTADSQCVTDHVCLSGQCVKKPNGQVCSASSQCQSGICHATEKVCCDKTCGAGPCESCALAGKLGTCSLRPAGTACNGGATKCVDAALTSYLTKDQCTGSSAACTAVKSAGCDPYRCASATACRTSCTAHAQCSSTVCNIPDYSTVNLFGTKNTCVPEASICYADAAKPAPGAGTRQSPYATIQPCVTNTTKLHVAVADGTYDENLAIGRQVALWGTGTAGTLVQHGIATPSLIKAVVQSNSGSVVTVNTPSGAPSNIVVLWGLRITRTQAGTGLPPLVEITNGSDSSLVYLVASDITNSAGSCVDVASPGTTGAGLMMKDVALSACQGVNSTYTQLAMENASISWVPKGYAIYHKALPGGNPLSLTDVHLGYSGTFTTPLTAGIYAVNSSLFVDRFRMANSIAGAGIKLENNASGYITNTQISNAGVGLDLLQTVNSAYVINSTIVNNAGLQMKCAPGAGSVMVYNSILWKKNATTDSWSGGCEFHNSQVQAAAATVVPGSNNASTDPLFNTVDSVNPYYHLSSASPCRDQGTTTGVPGLSSSNFLPLDLFNQPRVVNGQVDRGALEYQP